MEQAPPAAPSGHGESYSEVVGVPKGQGVVGNLRHPESLRDRLQWERTVMQEPVPIEKRVTAGVWWMANTMSYRAIGQQFGLAQSTVAGIVMEVTHAIADELLGRVVYLRNPDRMSASGRVSV
ncbi:UNVERIFIED_CONTAM: hypothetical protein K2H54_017480 [Gekko kuhli]